MVPHHIITVYGYEHQRSKLEGSKYHHEQGSKLEGIHGSCTIKHRTGDFRRGFSIPINIYLSCIYLSIYLSIHLSIYLSWVADLLESTLPACLLIQLLLHVYSFDVWEIKIYSHAILWFSTASHPLTSLVLVVMMGSTKSQDIKIYAHADSLILSTASYWPFTLTLS